VTGKTVEFVLDASVMAKWYSVGEELREEAILLRDFHCSGKIRLLAPSLILYEILNVIWKNKNISEEKFKDLVPTILAIKPETFDLSENQVIRALTIGREYYLPYHDCAYIGLAESLQLPLLTADTKQETVTKALGIKTPFLNGIKEYLNENITEE